MSSSIAGPDTTGPALPSGEDQTQAAHRMRNIVLHLAADDFAGRRVGTPAGRAAACWLAGHLGRLGVRTRMDEFTVTNAVKELSATPVLTWHWRHTDIDLQHRRDFAEHLASAHLSTVRKGHLEMVASEDIRGAWVLADALEAARLPRFSAAGAAGSAGAKGNRRCRLDAQDDRWSSCRAVARAVGAHRSTRADGGVCRARRVMGVGVGTGEKC